MSWFLRLWRWSIRTVQALKSHIRRERETVRLLKPYIKNLMLKILRYVILYLTWLLHIPQTTLLYVVLAHGLWPRYPQPECRRYLYRCLLPLTTIRLRMPDICLIKVVRYACLSLNLHLKNLLTFLRIGPTTVIKSLKSAE